ncbi:hypothetical protein [Acaryochloris sp. IP29b_bin.148]|uniref:hypothetical protein n=1 Tax=Acaryochloris sp. IP29b_bin.148 TaxID=2969218 RepID=UPI00261EC9D0|nr:hypothetical protein [Acaryochloris sp. IP29b_bin.148]
MVSPPKYGGGIGGLDKTVAVSAKGLSLAGIGSYLLLGLLIVNVLVLSLFVYLPGKLITFKAPAVAQTGLVLLKLLLMGCLVILKTAITHSVKLIFELFMLVLAALTYPPRQAPQIAAHC